MKTIKIKTSIVDAAARESGMTAVEFVSRIRSLSLGRKVCAHLKCINGAYSVFICQ
jgi:hypothetical protein